LKVGDLVELSAKGKKLWYCKHAEAKIGIVIEIKSKELVLYPIRVRWFKGKSYARHLRSSLKFVSRA